MAAQPVGVGIIGAGNISDQYLKNLTTFPDLRVLAIGDLLEDRAREQAAKYGVPIGGGIDVVLDHPDIEIVINLTVPAAHVAVSESIIAAGKHVWGEKPLTLDRPSARELLDAAREAGVSVGNAPDTILGEAIQTSHRLLLDGVIGEPQTVLTLMQGPGPDGWHPRPQFLFAKGAGPLFDIGPYYFTTLVQLLGPIASVQALGHREREVRTVMAGPDAGQTFPVEIYSHVSVLTRFVSGVVGTSVYSFDSPVHRQLFEITGSAGTMEVPVSGFDGPTRLLAAGSRESTDAWQTVPPAGAPRGRGVGVLEMARGIRSGRQPLASGELAYHVLDAMLAVEESIDSGMPVAVESGAAIVEALPEDWDPASETGETA